METYSACVCGARQPNYCVEIETEIRNTWISIVAFPNSEECLNALCLSVDVQLRNFE